MNYLLNPQLVNTKKSIMSQVKNQKLSHTQLEQLVYDLVQVVFKRKQDKLNLIIETNLLYQTGKIPKDIKDFINHGIKNLSKIDNIDKLTLSFILNEYFTYKNYGLVKREK